MAKLCVGQMASHLALEHFGILWFVLESVTTRLQFPIAGNRISRATMFLQREGASSC